MSSLKSIQRALRRAAVGAGLVATVVVGLAAPAQAAFPGENGNVAFTRNLDIWVTDPAGRVQTRLTDRGVNEGPAYSPDGSRIVFSRPFGAGNFEVVAMDSDGTDVTRLTSRDGFDGSPSFSPSGQRIVFSSDRNDGGIFVMRSDGTRVRNLTERKGSSAMFSPDGSQITFDRQPGGVQAYSKLFIMDSDGTNVRRVTDAGSDVDERDPSFAPDGSRIAFERFDLDRIDFPDGEGIFTVEPDGSDLMQVTFASNLYDDASPAYSPDGGRIVFERHFNCPDDECRVDLRTVAANGTDLRQVTSTGPAPSPDWGSEGSVFAPATASCNDRDATLVGTFRQDLIRGTGERDVIAGLGGDDTVMGRGGNDLICGGDGADQLKGGEGTDGCRGGAGEDSLNGCERRLERSSSAR